jgi:hypothetical protein
MMNRRKAMGMMASAVFSGSLIPSIANPNTLEKIGSNIEVYKTALRALLNKKGLPMTDYGLCRLMAELWTGGIGPEDVIKAKDAKPCRLDYNSNGVDLRSYTPELLSEYLDCVKIEHKDDPEGYERWLKYCCYNVDSCDCVDCIKQKDQRANG